MERKNTFGDYQFPDWVPPALQESIWDFWGQFNRDHTEWLRNGVQDVSQTCHHGPGPNGFCNPPMGAQVIYLIKDYDAEKRAGRSERLYRTVHGKYIHAWNNMGRVVHDDGTYTVVSSCDMWVRVWGSDVEKQLALS